MDRRTVCFRLDLDSVQDAALRRTLALSRQCFETVAEAGWALDTANGVTLHKATYYALRERHPELPSQLVVSARMKASEALGSVFDRRHKGRKVSCPKSAGRAIRYDARSATVRFAGKGLTEGRGSATLASVVGRVRVGFRIHAHAEGWIARAQGIDSAELTWRQGAWHLKVALSIAFPEVAPSGKARGLDFGVNRPVVTSDGRFLGSRHWRRVEDDYFRMRRSLQAKGTKSAKRRLRAMRNRWQRFRLDCDRVIAKRATEDLGPGDTLALENLTHIRDRARQRGPESRRRFHGWSFARLKTCVGNKCQQLGLHVAEVDPRHTSQRCSACGAVDRKSRKGPRYHCRSCGFQLDADLNAARNIAARHTAAAGMSGRGGLPVNQPSCGETASERAGVAHKLGPSGPSR